MSYSTRIRTLEESYKQIELQISVTEKQEPTNEEKLKKLRETKSKYLSELRELRRLEYEQSQMIDYGDDR